jgi:predicted porin
MVAAAGLMMGSVAAQAADLGGNCCADLEERVAELEATTARKGNRKVKLTVSGQVNEAVVFWDDGAESNTYVVSNNYSRTRFRFVGDAKINADWSAGYLLEIGVRYANSQNRNQFGNDSGSVFDVRHSAWWIDSKTYGRLWVGHTSTASDGITEINLANSVIAGPDPAAINGGFLLRRSGTVGNAGLSALTWQAIWSQWNPNVGEGDRRNTVKYVSPTFMGFVFQAAWGEDDMWDAALRYAGEFSGFRVAAGIGYQHYGDTDPGCANLAPANNSGVDCHAVGMSASVMHVATGLFVTGSYGWAEDDNRQQLYRNLTGNQALTGVEERDEHWWVQAGIQKNWFGLGNTLLYGEYGHYDSGANLNAGAARVLAAADQLNSAGANRFISGTEIDFWGLGVVQSIDAAAMDLYIGYKHFEADVQLSTTGSKTVGVVQKSRPIDDWQAVMAGGIIRF